MSPRRKVKAGIAAIAAVLIGSAIFAGVQSPSSTTAALVAPTSPPVTVCGNSALLTGPSTPPSGSVTIPAGLDTGSYNTPSTVYYFAAGTHTLGTGQYTQIIPGNNDSYIGAPGAVLSGQQLNDFAFTGSATGVTVEYLTITDFGVYTSDSSDSQGGVVNQDSSTGWTIKYDTITENGGAGAMLGTNNVFEYNCAELNGQYGFQTYQPPVGNTDIGSQNVTVNDNEFYNNDMGGYDELTGCGCAAAAGKFWDTVGFTFDYNYVHTSSPTDVTFQGDPCVWADTDNSGGSIEFNYLTGCNAEGIIYEVSYFNQISYNTILDSGWGYGPTLSGFPLTAIYVSESGYDSRAPDETGGAGYIQGNTFTNDWGGVLLWENSNRFGNTAGSGISTSTGDGFDGLSTLVDPTEVCPTPTTKAANVTDYWDCRYRSQDVDVTNNAFSLTPSVIGSSCTAANWCGFNGVFSEYASYTPYINAPSPNECDNEGVLAACGTPIPNNGFAIPVAIATDQHNVFSNNTYCGPWEFDPLNQGDVATFAQWQAGYADGNGANATSSPQDAGSTLTATCGGGGTTTTTAPTTTTTQPTTTTTQPTTTTTQPTTTTTQPTTTTTAPTTTTTQPQGYTGPVVDVTENVVGNSSLTTPEFSTSGPQELLVVSVSGRGQNTRSGTQNFACVDATGLAFTAVSSTQSGTEYAEVFEAVAVSQLTNDYVTCAASHSGEDLRLQLAAIKQ